MNKKKKWFSLLTIATSLVLCIISTFGITLAFFGGNASANLSTITLKTGIEIGAAIESSVGSAKVVPGQPVKITATGTVSATDKGSANANNAVDGVVRAKFNVGNELGTVTIAGNNTDFWTAGNDGYYYLVTAANGTTLRTVSKGTSVQIFGDLTVSKNFTNADSGKSVEASVIFEVIQADIYKADGTKETLTVTNATTSTSPLYASFNAVKLEEKYKLNITIEHGEYSYDLALESNNFGYMLDGKGDVIQIVSADPITVECSSITFGSVNTFYEMQNATRVTQQNYDYYIYKDSKDGEFLFKLYINGMSYEDSDPLQTYVLTGDTNLYIYADNVGMA